MILFWFKSIWPFVLTTLVACLFWSDLSGPLQFWFCLMSFVGFSMGVAELIRRST